MESLTYFFASSDADLQGAYAVRMEVFTREQQVPPEEELDEYDKTARHLVVKEGDRVVATARLYLPAPDEARLGRMAVLGLYRRRGIGRKMLGLLCAEGVKAGASRATLHAQWHARPFYASCGFQEYGAPFWEAGIKHVSMVKAL